MIDAVLALAMLVAPAGDPQHAVTVTAGALPEAPSTALLALVEAPAPPVLQAMVLAATPVRPERALIRPNRKAWLALTIAQHSAASFDAWTTRRALSLGGFHETNPMLRPFAGNASMYAAIQTTPLVFDYLGARLQRSQRRWVRRLWWVPQTVQTVINVEAGISNLRKVRRRERQR